MRLLFQVRIYEADDVQRGVISPAKTVRVLAHDDVEARAKGMKEYQKGFRKENGVAAPALAFCETELITQVDVE